VYNTSIKQFAIYSRKSRFTGKGESIGNQIELCRQYIAAHYSQTEAENALIYEDEGYSGGTLDRPQYKKMMKDSHTVDLFAVVVYRLDRISRSIGDFANLIEDLGERKIAFISIREQFDTSSPMGRAMMYIASVFSQLERETIAERIRDNMRELAKTGRWLGGTTPTGYESEHVSRVTIDGKTRKACRLKKIPEEIEVVRMIYSKFMETGSLTKVDQFLMEKQILTKNGNRFTRFAVKSILSNPVYMIADKEAYRYFSENHTDLFAERSDFDGVHGIMAYNRTLQKPGKTHQIKSMEEWIVSVGGHEGIIPGDVWVCVQNKLEWNRSKSRRRPRNNTALLAGILYCASCGKPMRPKQSGRVNTNGEPIYTYLCTTKELSRRKHCDMKNPSGNLLDDKIIGAIKVLSADSQECIKRIQQTKELSETDRDDFSDEKTKTMEAIKEKEETVRRLVAALVKAQESSAEEYIRNEIEQSHEEISILRKHLSALEEYSSINMLSEREFAVLQRTFSSFGSVIDDMNPEQKRSAVRTLVKRIVWDGENVHLYFFDPGAKPSGEDSK